MPPAGFTQEHYGSLFSFQLQCKQGLSFVGASVLIS
jgi:hypothetical protein